MTTIYYLYLYLKCIIKNQKLLGEKFGLNIDIYGRLFTIISFDHLSQDEYKTYGFGLIEKQIATYTVNLNLELEKLKVHDLVKIYDLKPIDDLNYGVTFGFSKFNTLLAIKITLWILLGSLFLYFI